ncbi:ParB N-terminal domain-containing protein [Microterricola viridarii]|uniref:Chromosome partitioning protein, ParB family n=1 Tax=Microterricola viridarii TaxID=412690 RepID=A0A1H1VGU1_9MICO|nr:ParB/RepB/Spo0J family partition protein [Microterricola viridarii]SDS83790.1 chromosome partitioning protein, ParB family [Microterricola viridarii]
MTSTPGHIELERSIDSIRIGARHRTDLGDIDALAASIERQGLLQPITVTPDGILVCGARRLAALRQLGVRKLNVWVRSGISDRLTQLLAEQDDNALHKSLSPTEAATLYREVKALLAEEARHRQESSRFGAAPENRRSGGAATVAAPVTLLDGYARAQAALLVTGRRSYTTLDRISDVQRITADESVDPTIREQAQRELSAIEAGGSVASAHRRLNTQLTLAELEHLAADAAQPAGIRQASSVAAARVHAAERSVTAAELEQLAREALARVKAAPKAKGSRPAHPSASTAITSKLPTRSFVFLWNDLHDWWLRYDVAEIAAELTEEQWEQFEAALAGTLTFAERMRAQRSDVQAAAREAQAGAPS